MCLRFLTLTQRHILHYPCRETIFGLSCVVFQSSSIEQSLMNMQKHLRYRRLEALVWPSWQWLFGGWSFSCLAFAGPLVTLSWCPCWLLENWFQNSTFHHCHPAQVWTSQHIGQPNYRIICFEAINNSIKNIALEPFPCGLNALVQGLRSWKILFFLVQLEGVETWRLENMGEADGCEKDASMRRWQLMAFNHSGDFRM